MSFISANLRDFDAICASFKWNIPEYSNIAHEVCDRHTRHADDVALFYEHADGNVGVLGNIPLKRSNGLGG